MKRRWPDLKPTATKEFYQSRSDAASIAIIISGNCCQCNNCGSRWCNILIKRWVASRRSGPDSWISRVMQSSCAKSLNVCAFNHAFHCSAAPAVWRLGVGEEETTAATLYLPSMSTLIGPSARRGPVRSRTKIPLLLGTFKRSSWQIEAVQEQDKTSTLVGRTFAMRSPMTDWPTHASPSCCQQATSKAVRGSARVAPACLFFSLLMPTTTPPSAASSTSTSTPLP